MPADHRADAAHAFAVACESLARRDDLTFRELEVWALDVARFAAMRDHRGLRGGDPFDHMRGCSYKIESEDGHVKAKHDDVVQQHPEPRDTGTTTAGG